MTMGDLRSLVRFEESCAQAFADDLAWHGQTVDATEDRRWEVGCSVP